MRVFVVLIPVLLVIAFGVLIRKRKVMCEKTVSELKYLLTNNILPIAIFNALATAEYAGRTWIYVGLMMAMLFLSFGIGFLMRPLINPPYQKYVPFLVTAYEGGMIAYPLYAQLCGSENLSKIAILDIAGVLFGFGFYMNVLTSQERAEKASFREEALNALRTPAFLASLLGVILGCSGLMKIFLGTNAGEIYTAAVQTITVPLSTMILLVVGYGIQVDRKQLASCLKTMGLRIALQAGMTALVLFAMHRLADVDPLTDKAILIYMSAPASYGLQSFIKDQRANSFASTFDALYIFVSVAAFALVSQVM